MKYFWIPALISIGIAVVVLLGEDEFVIFGAFIGFLSALVTLASGLACIKACRDPEVETDTGKRITRWQAAIAGVGSVAIMIGYIMLAMTTLAAARETAKMAITEANLRGVGQSLRLYVAKHHDYPRSLGTLVDTGFESWGSLWAWGDPDYSWDVPEAEARYSSFDYRPGSGKWSARSGLVLAYERDAWSMTSPRILFRKYGRNTLFGDGRVDCLDGDAFRAALEKDAAARREAGWPIPEPN